jgi:hypothetical protein
LNPLTLDGRTSPSKIDNRKVDVDFDLRRSTNWQEERPMQYLMMIYSNEGEFDKIPEQQRATIHQEFNKLREELGPKFVGGNQLQPTATATVVRVRDGKRHVTDGPFAETKEQLGGYILIDAADLDEVIAIAARLPVARFASIEVRPLAVRAQATQA